METAVLVTIFLITVLRQPCVAEPVGDWTDTVSACIKGNSTGNSSGSASTMAECRELCESQTDFRCLSVDFVPTTGECFHSRYNRNSVPPTDDFTQPCYLTGYQYSERRDLDFPWTETVEACIRLNNHGEHTVSSMEECQLLCERETTFPCLSVDFRGEQCLLSRYNRESIRPLTDYTQPCYIDGYQYAERVDKNFPWTETVEACIRLNNHGEHTVSSMEECQLLCEGETTFPCLSVDFRGEQCLLSRYNRESIRPLSDYTQPCYIDGYQYAERVDKKYFWTDIAPGCIRLNNDERHEDIDSLEDCKQLCIEETSFACLSVDYFPDSDDKVCLLSSFNRNSVQPSSDFTQPCYSGDGVYAERVNVGQWIPIIEDSCITGFNEWEGDVEDFESCKILCSQRSNCCSVDYNRDSKRCLLTSETMATVSSSDFISPCNGFSYAERIDVRCVT